MVNVDGDWPLRDKNASRQPYVDSHVKFPMSLVWDTALAEETVAPPVCQGGVLYVASVAGIHAIETKNGRVRWSVPTEQASRDKTQAHMISTPAVVGDRLYFCDDSFNTTCIDTSDGNVLWTTKRLWSSNDSICAHKDFLLLRTRHYARESYSEEEPGYLAIDKSGELIWKFRTRAGISTREAAAENGIIVFGDESGWIYGVDAHSGELRWELQSRDHFSFAAAEATRIRPLGFPTIVGDIALVLVGDRMIMAVGLSRGTVRWSYVADGPTSRHVCDRSRQYFVRTIGIRNWVERIELESGMKSLSREIDHAQIRRPGVYEANGLVIGEYYFATFYERGVLAVFDTEGGDLVWLFDPEHRVVSSPIFVDGLLFLVDHEGTVYAFRSGKPD